MIDPTNMPEPLEKEVLLSAYLDGELSADEVRTVEQLLASDPHARVILDELRALRGQLRGLESAAVPEGLKMRILAAIDARKLDAASPAAGFAERSITARRPHARPQTSPGAPPSRNRRPMRWLAMASLAASLLVGAWWLSGSRKTEELAKGRRLQAEPSLMPDTAAPTVAGAQVQSLSDEANAEGAAQPALAATPPPPADPDASNVADVVAAAAGKLAKPRKAEEAEKAEKVAKAGETREAEDSPTTDSIPALQAFDNVFVASQTPARLQFNPGGLPAGRRSGERKVDEVAVAELRQVPMSRGGTGGDQARTWGDTSAARAPSELSAPRSVRESWVGPGRQATAQFFAFEGSPNEVDAIVREFEASEVRLGEPPPSELPTAAQSRPWSLAISGPSQRAEPPGTSAQDARNDVVLGVPMEAAPPQAKPALKYLGTYPLVGEWSTAVFQQTQTFGRNASQANVARSQRAKEADRAEQIRVLLIVPDPSGE